METIKIIQIDGVNYELKATYDSQGNIISSYYASTQSVDNKADKVSIVEIEGSSVTQEIQPNKLYIFGEVTNLTITLSQEISGILNEYMFQFTSGSTATILSLPETIKWIGDNTIESNKTYQVSIINNLAVLGGVTT